MTTIFFCDRSEFQGRARATGALALCARASEGNWLADPEYQWNKAEAARVGAFFWGYHFLEAYSGAASQAAFCHSIVGRTPLMLDFEPIAGATPLAGRAASGGRKPAFLRLRRALAKGSYPAVSLALAFIDEYRALGGTCHVVYMPRWYWASLGSPSLQRFRDRGCVLVSSQYTAYSDHGPGWAPYTWAGGSWSPKIWQYSDSVNFNGATTDFNAFKSSASTVAGAVAELESWVRTGKPPSPPKPPPKPKPPKPATQEDDVAMLAAGTGAQTIIRFAAGSAKGIAFANDATMFKQPAPVLRVAAHSASGRFHVDTAFILTASGADEFTFTAGDVDFVNITRASSGEGDIVAVGWTLT